MFQNAALLTFYCSLDFSEDELLETELIRQKELNDIIIKQNKTNQIIKQTKELNKLALNANKELNEIEEVFNEVEIEEGENEEVEELSEEISSEYKELEDKKYLLNQDLNQLKLSLSNRITIKTSSISYNYKDDWGMDHSDVLNLDKIVLELDDDLKYFKGYMIISSYLNHRELFKLLELYFNNLEDLNVHTGFIYKCYDFKFFFVEDKIGYAVDLGNYNQDSQDKISNFLDDHKDFINSSSVPIKKTINKKARLKRDKVSDKTDSKQILSQDLHYKVNFSPNYAQRLVYSMQYRQLNKKPYIKPVFKTQNLKNILEDVDNNPYHPRAIFLTNSNFKDNIVYIYTTKNNIKNSKNNIIKLNQEYVNAAYAKLTDRKINYQDFKDNLKNRYKELIEELFDLPKFSETKKNIINYELFNLLVYINDNEVKQINFKNLLEEVCLNTVEILNEKQLNKLIKELKILTNQGLDNEVNTLNNNNNKYNLFSKVENEEELIKKITQLGARKQKLKLKNAPNYESVHDISSGHSYKLNTEQYKLEYVPEKEVSKKQVITTRSYYEYILKTDKKQLNFYLDKEKSNLITYYASTMKNIYFDTDYVLIKGHVNGEEKWIPKRIWGLTELDTTCKENFITYLSYEKTSYYNDEIESTEGNFNYYDKLDNHKTIKYKRITVADIIESKELQELFANYQGTEFITEKVNGVDYIFHTPDRRESYYNRLDSLKKIADNYDYYLSLFDNDFIQYLNQKDGHMEKEELRQVFVDYFKDESNDSFKDNLDKINFKYNITFNDIVHIVDNFNLFFNKTKKQKNIKTTVEVTQEAINSEKGQLRINDFQTRDLPTIFKDLGLGELEKEVPYNILYPNKENYRGLVEIYHNDYLLDKEFKIPQQAALLHGISSVDKADDIIERLNKIQKYGGLKSIAERRRCGIKVQSLSPIGDMASGIDMGVPCTVGYLPSFGSSAFFLIKPTALMRRDIIFAPTDYGGGHNRQGEFDSYAQSIGQDNMYDPPDYKAREKHFNNNVSYNPSHCSANEAYIKGEIDLDDIDYLFVTNDVYNDIKKVINKWKQKGLPGGHIKLRRSYDNEFKDDYSHNPQWIADQIKLIATNYSSDLIKLLKEK